MDDQLIKVYATSDGGIAHWTNPRRVHLHKKTPSGTTVCRPSVIAGGIVQGRAGAAYFVTTDSLVPSGRDELQSHADTNDGTCARIGQVRHADDELHFALIAIGDTVAHGRAVAAARDRYFSSLGPTAACLHRQALKCRFQETGVALLARTRYDEAIHGVVTSIPGARHRPSASRAEPGALIGARFGGRAFPGRSRIDVGMWVYARRAGGGGGGGGDAATDEMLDAKDVGPYRPETFRYCPVGASAPDPNPLVLVGHVVEVRGRDLDADGSVAVGIQGLYEVLERVVLFGV
ncbi:hypothetical protein F4818DRAFT_455488 [Hypoxylon cercidicola]|nr:hypothetical protein F4818DRAFT_455488 [Hypoxylon cercidicola]